MASSPKDVAYSRFSTPGRHRELVRRVVNSSTFAKSKRLSAFLAYICEQTLNGHSEDINEQRIGEYVFGRSPNYDSSIDGIVRTQGSRLRQRLERYFNEEGIAEPVKIIIPRGGYVPIFEPRFPSDALPSETVLAPASLEEGFRPTPLIQPVSAALPVTSGRHRLLLWTGLAAVAIMTLSLFVRHRARSASQTHMGNPLWSHMFAQGKRTLIVPGDSGLVIWEGLMGRRIGLSEFLKGDYRNQAAPNTNSPEGIASDLSKRRYTTVVDLEVLQFMTRLAQSGKGELEVRYARDLRPNDLKDGNVILVGANEANPWVELYEPLMNFTFYSDPVIRSSGIRNRSPQAGEPGQWDMGGGMAYAIVAYLPSLTDKGDSLIIGGTSMTGTESALDFIADDAQLLPFLHRIQRPDGRLPHFQMVLGTNGVTGNAVRSRILAWRVTD